MKIAILGGSFNPPHNGHVTVANEILRCTDMGEVWLMPCGEHPFHKSLISKNHRQNMTRAIAGGKIRYCDFEINQNKITFSIDTLDSLSRMYQNIQFFWIIGSDQVEAFDKWKDWGRILLNYKLIIYPRLDKYSLQEIKVRIDNKFDSTQKENIVLLDNPDLKTSDASSSLIRDKVRKHERIDDLVPQKVAEYIYNNKIYK